MTRRARKLRWRGTGEYRDEAEVLLELAGDAATVNRGRVRSLILRCPDGCGDTLSINLDPRAGKAWRLDVRRGAITLYPSVWREDSCRSHFILWRDHIIWCGRFDGINEEPAYDAELEALVFDTLDGQIWRTGFDVALELDEIVWEIGRVLRRLAQKNMVEEQESNRQRRYRRRKQDS